MQCIALKGYSACSRVSWAPWVRGSQTAAVPGTGAALCARVSLNGFYGSFGSEGLRGFRLVGCGDRGVQGSRRV